MPNPLNDLARLFTGTKRKPPPPPRRKPAGKGGGSLDAYKRTYGDKDGQTVFDAAQIKAKRRKKR